MGMPTSLTGSPKCHQGGEKFGVPCPSPKSSVPTVLSLLMRQVSGPSWIMRREVRSRL